MPIYEYECPECGRFETIQKFSDKPLAYCPKCKESGKKSAVKKAVSASAFHLKGSGWYKTDYSSGASGSSAKSSKSKADSSSPGESTAGGEKSDTKSTPSKACGSGGGGH